MRCFSGGGGDGSQRSTIRIPPTSSPLPPPPPTAAAAEEEDNRRRRRRTDQSPTSSSAQTSTAASPAATINLRREYTLAVQTNSYNEIWYKIHHHPAGPGEGEVLSSSSSSADLIDRVLQPDRASIQEALRTARPTHLTSLVSRYFDSSEHTSHLFLSLRRSVDRASSIYAPISDLLEVLPNADHSQLSQAQCDWAFDTFLEFNQLDNPFPAPTTAGGASCSFDGMRHCFAELKHQLDIRLLKARRRHRLLRRATRGSAACLIASAAGVVLTGLVIATHALVALVAAGPTLCGCLPLPTRDLMARRRRQLLEHMQQVDAAARETYVLNNNLDTIERLVARLHATVESDKVLVRLGLERGRGQRHPIQEVVRHLRKNQPSFLHQLRDLDEHICLCFAAVNRARSLLLQQIHC